MKSLNFFKKIFNFPILKRGFTLVELIVVIAIATTIMTALVVQQNAWNDNLAISTQIYELMLMIRQAQVYSLGVKEYIASSQADKFNIGYGVYVSVTSPNQYIFFADDDDDQNYDIGEELETKSLTKGVYIHRICSVVINSSIEVCSNTWWGILVINRTSITFKRPNIESEFRFWGILGNSDPVLKQEITIYMRSPKGEESSVKVESNGQVRLIQ